MKLKAFQKYLQEEEIDLVFLVHPDIHITYFSQIKPSYAILTITTRKADLYLTSLDKKPQLSSIFVRELKQGWEKRIADNKVKKVGINKGTITISTFEKIKKLFPKAKFVDVAKKLEDLRSTKTLEEIKKISQACQITDYAFNSLIEQFDPKRFKTEQDVAFFLEKKIKEKKGTLAFPTIVAGGKNAAIPHHLTSTTKLKKGCLLLDFGANYKNYCSDMSRTLFLGTSNKDEDNKYELLLFAQERAISKIKENEEFINLDSSVRKDLGKYSSHFIHSLGHGVGLEIHEKPSFLQKERIYRNQVFTIEPGIYFPGKCGIRIEDTLIFDGKTKILTKSAKDLIRLKI